MKYSYTIEGDVHEDSEQLKIAIYANSMCLAIDRARNIIRHELKHGSIIDEKFEKILNNIYDTLYYEEL